MVALGTALRHHTLDRDHLQYDRDTQWTETVTLERCTGSRQ